MAQGCSYCGILQHRKSSNKYKILQIEINPQHFEPFPSKILFKNSRNSFLAISKNQIDEAFLLHVDQAAVLFCVSWKLDVLRALARIHRETVGFLIEAVSCLGSATQDAKKWKSWQDARQVSTEEPMKLIDRKSHKSFQFYQE